MNHTQARSNIRESMKRGAAQILDRSCVLPAAELTAAVVRAQRGNSLAGAQVVDGMSRIVYQLAEHYYLKWSSHLSPSASFCDVFSEGLVGLHRAVLKFDPKRELAFTTLATWWIRNAVQRACYAAIGIARIPEKQLLLGVKPDDALVAALSLDHRRDGGRELHETLADDRPEDDLELVRDLVEVLRLVDGRLPRIAQLVQEDVAVRQIGRIMGISGDRVRQLLRRGAAAVERSGLVDLTEARPAHPDRPAPAAAT